MDFSSPKLIACLDRGRMKEIFFLTGVRSIHQVTLAPVSGRRPCMRSTEPITCTVSTSGLLFLPMRSMSDGRTADAVSTGGTQNSVIGVATSDSLDLGTWTDHGSTGLLSQPGEGYNAIDPCLILLPDGTYQLVFGSQWQQIYYVDMQTSLLQIGNDIQGPISHGSHLEEGSYLYFYNDYYYLFVSAGNCCGFSESHHPTDGTEYHVTVCRSNSATTGFVSTFPK